MNIDKQIEEFKKEHSCSEIVLLCSQNRKEEFEKMTSIEVKPILNMQEDMWALIDKFYLDDFILDNQHKV